MGWSSMSFPFGSLLAAAKMTQVFSNFASLAYQESGAPQLGGLGNISVGSGLSIPGVASLGHTQAGSGFAGPGVSSFDSVSVASGYSAPGVSSFDQIQAASGYASAGVASFGTANAASGFNLRGVPTKHLLQRIPFFSTTSRGTTSAVFSTYAVASITPLSSLSTILVRAGIYYTIIGGGAASTLDSHLMRNPTGAASSFAYLTNSAVSQNANVGAAMGAAWGNNIGLPIAGLMAFEAADSAGNLDARQYGIDWHGLGGSVIGIQGGYVTVEEWL